MTILGIEQITYGVTDLDTCRRFLADWGLTEVSADANGARFETLNGARVLAVRHDDSALPPAMEEGPTLREVTWGVTTAQEVAAIAERYGVSVPQLCIRYTLQLGTVSLPKTADPDHLRANAQVDFVISEEDMDALRHLDERDYGASAAFPVYSGK